jgi:hypothetical protein
MNMNRPKRLFLSRTAAMLGALLAALTGAPRAHADFGVTVDLGGAPYMNLGTLTPGQEQTPAVGFNATFRTDRNQVWKVKLIVGGIKHESEEFYLPLNRLQYKLVKSLTSNGTPTDGWDVWTAAPYQDWKDVYTAAESESNTTDTAFGVQFKFTSIPALQRSGSYYGDVHIVMYDAD